MKITAWIIAGLAVISAAMGTLTILQIPSEPIISDKLTWPFWMATAAVLLLLSIIFLLGGKTDGIED